jgi:hypothetical protein
MMAPKYRLLPGVKHAYGLDTNLMCGFAGSYPTSAYWPAQTHRSLNRVAMCG